MAIASYVADTSATARLHHPAVRERLAPLIEAGLVATCTLIDLEMLYSTRTPAEHRQVRFERHGFEQLDIEQADWQRAVDVQADLAARGHTRAAGILDLLLAAAAERHRLELLHYDRDFDLIAAITGQPVRWVVPAGSVP